MTVLNDLINLLIIITLLFSVGFVAVYATSPWKISPLGKATMTWGASMVIWCCAGLVYSFLGPVWFYPWLRLLAYASTSWAMGTMLVTLIQVQQRVRTQIKDEDKSSVD